MVPCHLEVCLLCLLARNKEGPHGHDETRDFLASTVAATGAAVTQDLAHGAEGEQATLQDSVYIDIWDDYLEAA